MKVYIVMSVEYSQEEDEIWGYIYKEDQILSVYPTLEDAKEFVVSKASERWAVNSGMIMFKPDEEDRRIHYIFEKANELTHGVDLMWGVIIERGMPDSDNSVKMIKCCATCKHQDDIPSWKNAQKEPCASCIRDCFSSDNGVTGWERKENH